MHNTTLTEKIDAAKKALRKLEQANVLLSNIAIDRTNLTMAIVNVTDKIKELTAAKDTL